MTPSIEKPRIKKLPKGPRHIEEFPIKNAERTDRIPGLGEALEREADIVVVDEQALKKQQLDALRFANEPIAIRLIQPATENPPHCVPCWVGGQGAEIFQDGRWIAYGAFPFNVTVITKRKYVEVLARALRTTVQAGYTQHKDWEDNWTKRTTAGAVAFEVVEDRNPLGEEWLRRLRYFN